MSSLDGDRRKGRATRGLFAGLVRACARALQPMAHAVFLRLAQLPRGAGHGLALAFIAVAWTYAGILSSGSGSALAGAARFVGLEASSVFIAGHRETRQTDILDAIGIGRTRSLAGLDLADARRSVIALPWVKSATLRKLYPGQHGLAIVVNGKEMGRVGFEVVG